MSIEEKYDEVRQLINIGKEKGYLLYDEVNELLPSEITSSDELDDLFNTFGSAGIEVIDADQKYLRDDKIIDRTAEVMISAGTDDPARLRALGVIDLPTIQRYLNFHSSVTVDLFGADLYHMPADLGGCHPILNELQEDARLSQP